MYKLVKNESLTKTGKSFPFCPSIKLKKNKQQKTLKKNKPASKHTTTIKKML